MFKVWELWLSQYTLQLTKKEAAACGDCHADLAPWPKTRWPNSSFDMESDRSGLESCATLGKSHNLFELWFICKMCLIAHVGWFCGEYQGDNAYKTPSRDIA